MLCVKSHCQRDESEIKECYSLAASNNLVLLCALNSRYLIHKSPDLKDKFTYSR